MTESGTPEDTTAPIGTDAASAGTSEAVAALRSRIRPLPKDAPVETFVPFLDLCVNWSMDRATVTTEDLLTRDDLAFYSEDWGREGDIAVAAYAEESDVFGTTPIVGLAWLRLNTEEHSGYGWVASDIPELALAVLPAHQSRGIGGALLETACTLAKMSGYTAVSLSVEDGNGAARLYTDRGFDTVGRNGDSDILVRSFA